MTGVRRALLDDGAGERRGVVLLDGLPERLWIERDGEPSVLAPGMRATARVKRIDRKLALAFLDLGEGEAVLPLGKAAIAEGAAIEVEITAPARAGKAAVSRLIGSAHGAPKRLSSASPLLERLQAAAPGLTVVRGSEAREAADIAEDAVSAIDHPLGAGASLSIETTRGLTAIDVDVGAAQGAAKVNHAALFTAARLLRLKGLGGLVVFDLAGGGAQGEALMAAARSAFAPDMPGVAFGPVSRLGVFHLALPWRSAPVREQLFGPDGLATPRAAAQRLARLIEREAATAVRVRALAAPEVVAAAQLLHSALLARLGPRFDIQASPQLGRESFDVRAL